MKRPPARRATHQLSKAGRALPIWIRPVGEGAKRTTGGMARSYGNAVQDSCLAAHQAYSALLSPARPGDFAMAAMQHKRRVTPFTVYFSCSVNVEYGQLLTCIPEIA